ncbi:MULTISPECIES: endonuclease domain-containing protein [unclassified Blastococcus]
MPTPPVPPRVRRPTDRRRARRDGISDWHLRHRATVRSSRDTHLPREAAADLRGRVDAVLLGAPVEAVVSHLTAAALWGLQIPLVADDPRVHLTVPPGRRVRSRADRRLHCSVLPTGQVVRRRRVPVTSLERTWLDLAATLAAPSLLAVTDQLLRRGVAVPALEDVLAAAPSVRGVRTARRVLPLADPRAGSPMESVLRWLLHEAGLPRPELQHVVLHATGEPVGAVDLAWPEHRVVVEFDGEVHRDRRTFVDDLRRQNGLVLAGWTVLRSGSADVLGRPARVVAVIRKALAGS